MATFPVESPNDSEEFRAYVEACRVVMWEHADDPLDVVPILRSDLRNGLIMVGRGRADAAIAARRVTRKLTIAARLQQDSARSVLAAYNLFNDIVAGKARASTGKAFKI